MTELIPSYLLKINRAKKHLADLEAAVAKYRDSHPYEAYQTIKKRKPTWRMRFTSSPANTQIPIFAADLVYNLRSGLDHLAAALVPSSFASHVAFPIFRPGIWEPAVEGENKELTDARGRWKTYTRKMPPGAVAILLGLQPDQDVTHRVHHLVLVNRLSNTDRHTKFPVFASGLKNPTATIDGEDGTKFGRLNIRNVPESYSGAFLEDAGEIAFPQLNRAPTTVEIHGVPTIIIRLTNDQGNIPVPDAFANSINYIENEVIRPLLSYVRP
jgi:hypothetical protein